MFTENRVQTVTHVTWNGPARVGGNKVTGNALIHMKENAMERLEFWLIKLWQRKWQINWVHPMAGSDRSLNQSVDSGLK